VAAPAVAVVDVGKYGKHVSRCMTGLVVLGVPVAKSAQVNEQRFLPSMPASYL
jgi:hypothetical protein